MDVYRDAMVEHAEAFVAARLSIIRDQQESASDRLRAMEQLEARAMGRPTEHVETTVTMPSTVDELRAMTSEERRELLRQLVDRGDMPSLRAVGH